MIAIHFHESHLKKDHASLARAGHGRMENRVRSKWMNLAKRAPTRAGEVNLTAPTIPLEWSAQKEALG